MGQFLINGLPDRPWGAKTGLSIVGKRDQTAMGGFLAISRSMIFFTKRCSVPLSCWNRWVRRILAGDKRCLIVICTLRMPISSSADTWKILPA